MRRSAVWGLATVGLFSAVATRAFDFSNIDVSKAVSGSAKLARAAIGTSDAEEIQIGREVAANLAARYGFVENEPAVKYVNLVGQAVVRHCDRKKIPYHFAILRASEINAMAAPGGYVFITQGLLDSLKDESELAGVLAHEITHVTRQHIVKAIRQANIMEAGEDLASATGHDMDRYGKVSDFSIHLLNTGLSREDELEADKMGTLLAAKVGYDATGLKRTIETLQAKEKTGLLLSRFAKTHPPAADRLDAINKVLMKNKLTAAGRTLPERYAQNTGISNK